MGGSSPPMVRYIWAKPDGGRSALRTAWPSRGGGMSQPLHRRHGLAGVENVLGIEGVFEQAHGVQLLMRFVARQQIALHGADAVLGADRAGKFLDDVMHSELDLVPLRQKGRVAPGRVVKIEMQIAVAGMAEAARP